MKRTALAVAILALVSILPAQSQEKGSWRAANKTAKTITGDLTLAPEKLTVDFVGAFPIARIRPLSAAEIAAGFDADLNPNAAGNLYRVSIPGSRKFLGKNSLCGGDDTQWMATYVVGKSLQIAFFSGATPPIFTPEAITSTTNLCGIYGYAR